MGVSAAPHRVSSFVILPLQMFKECADLLFFAVIPELKVTGKPPMTVILAGTVMLLILVTMIRMDEMVTLLGLVNCTTSSRSPPSKLPPLITPVMVLTPKSKVPTLVGASKLLLKSAPSVIAKGAAKADTVEASNNAAPRQKLFTYILHY